MEEGNLLHKSNKKGKTMIDAATAAAGMNAIASISGGLGGLGGSKNSSKKAMKNWIRQFNMQKDWEKEKMQSSHQWEVQDLLNAGLNPVLSAGGTGAMNASAPNPSMPDYSTYENAKTQKLATAIQMMNAYTQAKAQSSQAELNEANKLKTEAEAGMIEPKAMAEIKHLNSATAVNKAQKQFVESETNKVSEETKGIKGGWLAKVLGTEDISDKKKLFATGASMLLGGGTALKAIKAYKTLKNATGFTNFLKSVR